MEGSFIGPMPVEKFFETFMNPAPEPRPEGTINFEPADTGSYETAFVDAVNNSDFAPGLTFVNTKDKPDTQFSSLRKPDISAFRADPETVPAAAPRDRVEWNKTELYLEVKPPGRDAFIKNPDSSVTPDARKELDVAAAGDIAAETRGQMISYAHAHNASQFRTHSFSVCLMGTEARLFYWDRSATVVTERFEWKNDPSTLAEFFWRFSHLDESERGRDVTVNPANEANAQEARAFLNTSGHYPAGILAEEELLDFEVCDDQSGVTNHYVAPHPVQHGASMIGRATTGFVAYDIQRKKCVWLKDTWRIDSDDIKKEGDIYRLLREKHVPNIATFACAGDVLANHAIQRTRAQDLQAADWACMTGELIPHVHYRLVLDTIGKKLKEFQSTRQLCSVLRDALLAHSVAFTAAKVLHRDISAGNVLIGPDGVGVLIDWDLSKILDANQEVWRQEWRTGTWQFISGRRLEDPDKRHEYSDDLESFIHVLVFHLLRYRPRAFNDLEDRFDELFDGYTRDPDGSVVGGAGKRAFFARAMLAQHKWDKTLSPPCASLVDALRSLFEPLYMERKFISDDMMALTLDRLRNAMFMLQLFDDSLKVAPEWEDDGPAEHITFRLPTREQDRRSLIKRTREESEARSSSKRQRRFEKENGRSGASSAAHTT